ncbi:alpha/beta fold hydrolase [Alteromonas oceanisediminis]|uniref:alpha/beta fold hydrolase n=1 Tax=Alteromonas oceanisediminis TaxID=2836180 RepID=UPI001BD9D8D3|nr:alpha/beta hydrolase [Alteromonas oceanisediminis]MBT0585592.1 alpha/beta hydrolase [Alteromonas oceanisediminis]
MQTVLFVPGTFCDQRLFSPQQAFLRERGINSQVAELEGGNTFADMSRTILAKAPSRFALCGLSMGGILAFELWRQAPDRISRLALLDTNPFAETQEKRNARNGVVRTLDAKSGNADENLADFVKSTLFPQYIFKPSDNEKTLETIVENMARSTGWTRGRSQLQALNSRVDSFATLNTISVPSIIICGEQDTLCPVERHTVMAEHIPESELHILPQCGHLSTLEQPKQVNELLLHWLNI